MNYTKREKMEYIGTYHILLFSLGHSLCELLLSHNTLPECINSSNIRCPTSQIYAIWASQLSH